MEFNIGSYFKVVKYKRPYRDKEPQLAFLQKEMCGKYLLWDGDKQILVSKEEMFEATPFEETYLKDKVNNKFKNMFSAKPKATHKTEVTEIHVKPHEEEDNMEVITPKKEMSDFDIVLAGEEDIL